MWNMKKSLLFAIALVAVILISMNMASADDKKTITPQEFVSNVAEVPGKVGNWFTGEVEKTKEYQVESFAGLIHRIKQNMADEPLQDLENEPMLDVSQQPEEILKRIQENTF